MDRNADSLDLRLIQQAQQGDAASQSRLAEWVRPSVYAYICRMTLDSEIAEDLSQDTMLRLIKNLPRLSFENTRCFWAWVYKTALNRIRDFYDEQQVRRLKASDLGLDRLAAWDRADLPASGLEHATRQELLAAVTKAMKGLRLRHRSILALRCFQQLSYAEITQVMGGSQLQAKLLFFRAKQSLRRQLARDGFDGSALLPGLGILAAVTLPAGQTATAATLVSAHSVKVSTWTAVLAAATSKVAMVILGTMVGLATVVTVADNTPLPSGLALLDLPAEIWTQGDAFSCPSRVLGVQDRDGNGLQAASGTPPMRVGPAGPLEEILVGRPSDGRPCLVLPPGHAVELGFDGPILDGPGPDILIAGWGCRHQQVFLTDGAQARFALPMAPCEGSRGQFGVLAIDLVQFTVPFEIRAIRIQGSHYFTQKDFYRLGTVRARTVP
jgi:RNA polymerase sigma-70 factor (ECF subfamily)